MFRVGIRVRVSFLFRVSFRVRVRVRVRVKAMVRVSGGGLRPTVGAQMEESVEFVGGCS